MPQSSLIRFRRGLAATWTSVNPTLASGEGGHETDTGRFKIGTGYAAWTALGYTDDGARAAAATATALKIDSAQRGIPSGVATLGVTGKLLAAQIPPDSTHVLLENMGLPNGVATLGSTGKQPWSQVATFEYGQLVHRTLHMTGSLPIASGVNTDVVGWEASIGDGGPECGIVYEGGGVFHVSMLGKYKFDACLSYGGINDVGSRAITLSYGSRNVNGGCAADTAREYASLSFTAHLGAQEQFSIRGFQSSGVDSFIQMQDTFLQVTYLGP